MSYDESEDEDDYNYFKDDMDGRMLITYMQKYFEQFDEITDPTKQQIIDVFGDHAMDMVRELEEITNAEF